MAETPALPKGSYAVITADPPWPFKDRLPGPGRGAAKWYDLMTIPEIRALDIASLTAVDAILFLWVPNQFLEEAHWVAKSWGFAPKTILTWIKVGKSGKPRMGMGRYLRSCTEQCLVATKGRFKPTRLDVLNVIFSPREGHSFKPEAFYDLVRSMTPEPRLELFARHKAPGFDVWGAESPDNPACPQ